MPEAGPSHTPLLSQALGVDEAVVAWLLGRYQPHVGLRPHARLVWPEETGADELLAGEARCNALVPLPLRSGDASQECVAPEGDPPLFVFHGPDRLAQEAAAHLLAARAGRPLLSVDLAAVTATGVTPLRALRLALRDARLTGAIAYLSGWEAMLADGAAQSPEEAGPSAVNPSAPTDLLGELCACPDLAIVAGYTTWQPGGIDRARPLFWLEFPLPAYTQRRALWGHFLDGETSEASEVWDLAALAGQFALTSGQIRDAVATARDMAAQAGRALTNAHLFTAARAHSNPHLGTLARKIEPRYAWDDIVLPDDQLALLHEIVATVRARPQVLEGWGVGRKLVSSAGVPILFAGPPGTGKTMAAEIIAAELALDLYKIDLSTVVSKYIGETEKNLERIFNEAETSNAILFFDEADAIFGKRSEVKDAHDRYANIEVSYLLQRMERYDGVTILATNLRANLDEAFARRLQFAVNFPFPEEADRRRIWETLFPPGVPREPELDFELFARRFKLAGGNIRNILVGAAYLAAADGKAVTMAHLLHGARRELQKMGRLVNEKDMAVQ
jgi:ATP-dependent 26S proteasome regulatory subunit